MFGVPAYAATVFMTMCVSALALTSLDAVARIGRMSFQELFSVDDMEHAEGWRKLLCNVYPLRKPHAPFPAECSATRPAPVFRPKPLLPEKHNPPDIPSASAAH